MTEHEKPRENSTTALDDAAKTKAEKAKAALADAVAKRTGTRKLSDRSARKAPHGGKPVSGLKVTDQVRGK